MGRRHVLGIMIVVLALVTIGYAKTGILSTDRTSSTTESTQGLDSDVVNQLPMSNAADEIYRLWQSEGYQDFAGLSFDNETWTVVLYWKDGALPSQMDTLVTELRETVPIRVVNATYSLEEIQTESKRLLQLGTVDGVDVNEAGPNGDFSTIKVGIDMSGDLTSEQKLEEARQAITSTYPLEFRVTGEPVKYRSRWDDSEPFYGGAVIDHRVSLWEYFYCTTGFAVTTDSGEEGMLTAAHCHYGWDFNTPEGDLYVGTVSNPGSCTKDASTLLGETYSPRVYVGDWEGSSSVEVTGWEYPTVGQYLYVSGGMSGEHRVRVESTFQYIDGACDPYSTGPGFWTEDLEGDGSAGEGDSGGPVIRYVTSSTVKGVGLISAGDTDEEADCEGYDGGRDCSSRVWHSNLGSAINALDVTLQ